MTEQQNLLASISETIKDYRAGDLPEPTPDHVDRWINQFDIEVHLPLLREMDHVLKQTYFSKELMRNFYANQITHAPLVGDNPCAFWQAAHVLDIQEHGSSQTDIRNLFGEALAETCQLTLDECGVDGGAYVYFDDVIFSGNRIGNDLSAWIENEAPMNATMHILVFAAHRLGEWQCGKRIRKSAKDVGKNITFHFWAAIRLENRKSYRAKSEVLWPATIPDDDALQAYLAEEAKFPFEPRPPSGNLNYAIFSSEEARNLLERELLLAGMRIRSFSQNPNRALRPLGFSAFGVGFGSTIVTYRNCPNNAPLALWWGDPNAAPGHPFSHWYPLVERKTYAQEVHFDIIEF